MGALFGAALFFAALFFAALFEADFLDATVSSIGLGREREPQLAGARTAGQQLLLGDGAEGRETRLHALLELAIVKRARGIETNGEAWCEEQLMNQNLRLIDE